MLRLLHGFIIVTFPVHSTSFFPHPLPFFASAVSYRDRPHGLSFTWWGCCCCGCQRHKPTELAHSFLFCSCVFICLYSPFNCILFLKFSRRLSVFSLCSSSLISASLVLSIIYPFMKVSLSPGIIPSD